VQRTGFASRQQIVGVFLAKELRSDRPKRHEENLQFRRDCWFPDVDNSRCSMESMAPTTTSTPPKMAFKMRLAGLKDGVKKVAILYCLSR